MAQHQIYISLSFLLVAVVICFFLCWAPFHAQRLAYMWAMKYMDDPLIRNIFVFTTYASGILYYCSTCVNPLVYNIMSNKFRQAFKVSLMYCRHLCLCISPSFRATLQSRVVFLFIKQIPEAFIVEKNSCRIQTLAANFLNVWEQKKIGDWNSFYIIKSYGLKFNSAMKMPLVK